MWISDLALNDFRSYTASVLSFEPGVSVFVGENGRGKTNLVEAIAYLATFRSHRVAADTALVRQGAEAAVVRAKVRDGSHSTLMEVEILAGKANRARLNRAGVRPRDLLGIVKAVIFAPEDLALISGEPATRRTFLDDVCIQHRPRFAQVRSEYDRVLRQRSALLKSAGKVVRAGGAIDGAAFDVWDEKLADLGSIIVAERAGVVAALRPHVASAYAGIAPDRGTTHVVYRANIDDESRSVPPPGALEEDGDGLVEAMEGELRDSEGVRDRMLAAMREARREDIERGVTQVGPHRDELVLGLGTLPAKGFASHGETWSYALSLRLAAFKLLKDEDSDPLLILDDVFAELDATRRAHLVSVVSDIEQVFVTTATGTDIPDDLRATFYRVTRGEVSRED